MKTLNIKSKTKPLAKLLTKILKVITSTSKKVYSKVMKFDLIDGQKRSETIARRLMILLLLFLSLYILIDLLVDNGVLKTNSQRRQELRLGKVVFAKEETILDIVENIDGDIITTKASGEVTVVPAEVFMSDEVIKVKQFTQGYSGSRLDGNYFELLRDNCKDIYTLKLVVAVSVAETSMGRNTNNKSNFWGFFKNGDRKYDPAREVMVKDICGAFGGYYNDIMTNKAKANKYVGYDASNWLGNVGWALNQMGVK